MYQKQLDAYLDSKKEEMLEDLKALVSIDSQRGEPLPGMPFGEGPARAVKAAGELMERYGLKVTNYDNYVITGDSSDQEKALDILAHLDVVPVTDEWTVTQPFKPVIRDGRIYGRGTADDKGPAIAALYAIRAVKELGIPLKYSVRLILGSDEECGSSDLEHYYEKEQEARFSFTPDADFPLINLEKARLAKAFTAQIHDAGSAGVVEFEAGMKVNVVPAKASAVIRGMDAAAVRTVCEAKADALQVSVCVEETEEHLVQIRVRGSAAHASTPELGVNAATALLAMLDEMAPAGSESFALLQSLSRLFVHGDTQGKALGISMQDEESGALTMNLGILRLKDGALYGEFDVRAPLCANDDNLTEVMRKDFDGIGIRMEEGPMKAAHYVPADSDLVKTLLGSYERYFGTEGKPFAIGGGTYVHELERGVAFGCAVEGVDNRMHGDDEFMEIEMLLRSAKIFADAIVKLCNLD